MIYSFDRCQINGVIDILVAPARARAINDGDSSVSDAIFLLLHKIKRVGLSCKSALKKRRTSYFLGDTFNGHYLSFVTDDEMVCCELMFDVISEHNSPNREYSSSMYVKALWAFISEVKGWLF